LKECIGTIILLCLLNTALYSQENKPSHFGHRVTIGNYNSFWEDDIGIIEAGYDFILNFPYITPEYNIENTTKLFAKISWFHTSNNDVYGRERNPSINAVGIAAGVQL